VVAFASLGLWLTATLATLSMLLWVGIGLWRAPEAQ
jgi:biotin transporter BioY